MRRRVQANLAKVPIAACLVALGSLLPSGVSSSAPPAAKPRGIYPSGFTYSTAIGPEKGVVRRDPSDVIEVKGVYFVWYTEVLESQEGYPSGYPGSIAYATSPDGRTWSEQGICLRPGAADAWDGHGVFTPNILVAQGKYYLFYTAVPEPFDVPYTKGVTPTAIGVAIADKPTGPWTKFTANPVLKPERDPAYFDSFRCDDASLIVRGGEYWLYYKGRQLGKSPGETKMGVAISKYPTGPYVKQKGLGELHRGHEVLVWPQDGGVASLASAAGPKGIYFAPDGFRFQMLRELQGAPAAAGLFRSDRFRDGETGEGLRWGICHASAPDKSLYLQRFDVLKDASETVR